MKTVLINFTNDKKPEIFKIKKQYVQLKGKKQKDKCMSDDEK